MSKEHLGNNETSALMTNKLSPKSATLKWLLKGKKNEEQRC